MAKERWYEWKEIWGWFREVQDNINQERIPPCKNCGSNRSAVLYGRDRKGNQRYYCKHCNKVYLSCESLPRMRFTIRQVGDALGQYYGGMSLKELKRQFTQQNEGLSLSRSTFDRWLTRFSNVAIEEAKKQKPKVGDKWVADETVLKIGGKNVWVFDIIDSDTRYLLATHITLTRQIKDVQKLMEKASEVAGKAPKVVLTDKLSAYIDGIELAFGGETRHIQSNPFTDKDSTNLIERFHSTLKTRTEIMRGLKSLDTAQTLLDGWLVHYNYFRQHESLDDITPAEAAKVNIRFKDWLEIVQSQSPLVKDYENTRSIRTGVIVPKSYPHKQRKPRRRYQRRSVSSMSQIRR